MPKNTLANILGGIRMAEGGRLQGDYAKRKWYGGEEYIGAYAIPRAQWTPWANFAGIKNAPHEDADAQDRVAATVLAEYYNIFGSWELAVVAWFAGPAETNKLIAGGGLGALSQRSEPTAEYLNAVMQGSITAEQNPQYNKPIHSDNLNLTKPGSGWINPVAGDSEWSRGSFMPRTKTHRGRTHGAIDVYADTGTPIVSPVSGRIVATKQGKLGGNTVTIMGDDGIKYYFAHMASEATVKKGQRIMAGHHVGYVGNSGSAKTTSPHLHMSMKKGNAVVNPATFLEQASAVGYNNRAISAERAVLELENPSLAPNQNMMTEWIQGLSGSMAGGAPELPPLNEIEAIRAGSQRPADKPAEPAVAEQHAASTLTAPTLSDLEEAEIIRASRTGGPR